MTDGVMSGMGLDDGRDRSVGEVSRTQAVNPKGAAMWTSQCS